MAVENIAKSSPDAATAATIRHCALPDKPHSERDASRLRHPTRRLAGQQGTLATLPIISPAATARGDSVLPAAASETGSSENINAEMPNHRTPAAAP